MWKDQMILQFIVVGAFSMVLNNIFRVFFTNFLNFVLIIEL